MINVRKDLETHITDLLFKKEKNLIDECSSWKAYKEERLVLNITFIITTIFPFLCSVLGTLFCGKWNWFGIIKSGDLLMLFFVLIAGAAIDGQLLYKGIEQHFSHTSVGIFKLFCILLTIIIIIIYPYFKVNEENDNFMYTCVAVATTVILPLAIVVLSEYALRLKVISKGLESGEIDIADWNH